MKQLLILSGKGGTGKTTIAGSFIELAKAKAYCDCDVDAPNLHLLYDLNSHEGQAEGARTAETADFYGMDKAIIHEDLCNGCGLCRDHCRFDAIYIDPEKGHIVDEFACEGCGVCQYLCPVKAISMVPAVAGELTLYKDESKVFSTAKLKMGSGNSGLLVTEVKKRMKNSAPAESQVAILDGSPGIGCPVIASVSGVDMVLIVSEPSISGISDMERIVKTAKQLGVSIAICVNKSDTNPEGTKHIETFCEREGLTFTGTIPYDPLVVKAVNRGETVVAGRADNSGPAAKAIKSVFEKTLELLLAEA